MKKTTLTEAIACGSSTFFTGRACKRGHLAERSTYNGGCIACRRIADRTDKAKKLRKGYHQSDAGKATRKRYKQTDKHKQYKKKYNKVYNNTRRALLKGSIGSYTIHDVERLMKQQEKLCFYCKVSIDNNYHVDHIYPLSKGGSNSADNIQLLCPFCNCSKKDKTHADYLSYISC